MTSPIEIKPTLAFPYLVVAPLSQFMTWFWNVMMEDSLQHVWNPRIVLI